MSKKPFVPKQQNTPKSTVTAPVVVANTEAPRTNWWGQRGCYNEPDSGWPDVEGFVINKQDPEKHANPEYYYRDIEDGTFVSFCKWFNDKKLAEYLAKKEAKKLDQEQAQNFTIQSPPAPQKNWQNKATNFKNAPPVAATKIEPLPGGYHKNVIDITKDKAPKPVNNNFGTTPIEMRICMENMTSGCLTMVKNMDRFEKRMGVYHTLGETQVTSNYHLRETCKDLAQKVALMTAAIVDLTERLGGTNNSDEHVHKKQRTIVEEDEDTQIPPMIELQHQVEDQEEQQEKP